MDQAPDGEAGASPPNSDRMTILLAEYAALRAEMERRTSIQWNVVALQVSSAGVLSSLALSDTTHNALLLLLPLSSYVFGSRYVLHDYHIKLINRYIRHSLSDRLGGHLEWQTWKPTQIEIDLMHNRHPAVVRWNVLHPTRLVFEGVAFAALVTTLVAGTVARVDNLPPWHIAVGLVSLWVLDVFALVALDLSFRRSS